MKSKILKRSIAIMLCMVIVLSGSGYLLAETFEEGNAEVMEASVTDVPAEDATVQEETTEAGSDATVEVEIPAQQEEASAPAAETPAAEAPAAETPAAESAEPIRQLTYEDDDVKVIVDATEAGNIPDGATLSVTPLEKKEVTAGMSAEEKAKIEEVNAQYDLTETKLQEKAENEEYDIAGFLAYDITFVDADGNKLEPNGNVKVSMEYKKAVVPEEVEQAEAEAKANNDEYKADVTVMHLEEDSNGTVKEVVDMVADTNEVATVDTTTTSKVKKAEFVTNSFSVFTITWKKNSESSRGAYVKVSYFYIDEQGTYKKFDENLLQGVQSDFTFDGSSSSMDLNDYILEIEGYTCSKIVKDDYTSTKQIRYLKTDQKDNYLLYSNDGSEYDEWLKLKSKQEDWKTGNIYYVYTSDSSSGGSGGSGGSGNTPQNTLDAPEHNKVIKYNSDTKDYTLTLDVTGKKGATVGADVLLVIDNSGSMGLNSSENTDSNHFNLMPSLKKIVKDTVVPKLLPDDESVNSIAAVSFSSYSSGGISTSWADYSGRQNIINKVNSLNPSGATNWQWAMRRAESKLGEKATSVNKKYVIFLSDGEPTKYFNNNGSEKGNGSEFEQNGFDYAVNEVTNSSYLKGATIYSVYLTSGTQSRMTKFATELKNQGVDARAVDGTQMGTSIDNILNEITTPAYTDVVIEDTLSQYVDFAEETPQFTVQYTEDGKTKELASDKYTVTQSGKKITLNLSNVGELDADTTYSISFKVKPSQTAIDYYKERSSYPHTGDAETDAPDNTTSSNRPGFYSNDTATVSYKVNGSQGDFSAEYKKPVVQVDASSIGPVTPALSEPEHKKTIYQNGKDDYTLSLDVKGAVGEATPIDVLLIIDESGSMNKIRRKNVSNAVKVLGEELMKSEAKDNIQIAAVTFSGNSTKYVSTDEAENDADIKMKWTKLTDFNYNSFTTNALDGTNWQAGVKKGEEVLALGRKKASKYVIFLTDGDPTFYYDDSGMTAGNGGSYDKDAYEAAETEWKNSSNMYAAGKYIVDATSGGDNKNCQDFATAVGAQVLNAKDETNMTAAFKKIAEDITKPEYTNVYIQDQLSEYVDFQDEPNLHVYADGKELATDQYTYTLDKATKTIRVNLLNGAALTKDVVYTIKFDVKPTEKAYFEYETNGTYNSVGDLNTDTNPKEKITSSDKLGFHSNNKAYVGYDVGISQGLTTDYDHPVVQVEPETVNHSVEKRWVRGSEAFVNVKLIAQYNVGTVDDPDIQMIDPTAYKALPQGTGMTQLLNGDNNWKYEWKNLPKYYYYTDENGVIQKTEILYSVEEVNPSEDYEVSYDAIENGTIITNTSKKEWKIIKQSDSVSPDRIPIVLEGAVFELRSNSADGKTYKGVSGADGIVTWVEVVQKESGEKEEIPVTAIAQDEYTLEEKNAPAGYSVSGKLWTVDYTIGSIPNIFDQDGEVVSPESEDGKVYTYVFENTPLYALPSAGGPGIFWYTIGGILLMMAAALILYKNKCREVLNR